MPGIQSTTSTIIPRNRPYPPNARDVARALRSMSFPGAQQIAQGFESLSDSLQTLHKATRENAPEIEEFLVTDGETGRVLAALGEYEKSGIGYSGGYFGELYAGDPYGDSDPAHAILSVTRDGKVQVGQNGWLDVLDPFGASAAWIGTQADRLAVTGAADNGSGLIRLTVTGHTLATSDSVRSWEIGGVPNATGIFTITKIDANHIDLQASVFVGTYTSGGYVNRLLHITGAADNGAGLIRITTAVAHTYESGDKANVASVGGVPNATGQWILTVIDSTHFDLVGSTWGGAYTSGGVCLRYFAGMLAQTFAIGNSFADYKLRAFANGDLRLRNATITLTETSGGVTSTIELDPTLARILVSSSNGAQMELRNGFLQFRLLDGSGVVDPDGGEATVELGLWQMEAAGIGTMPASRVVDLYGYTGSDTIGPLLSFTQARGTVSVTTATQSGDTLGGFVAYGYDGAGETDYAAAVLAEATENHAGGSQGALLRFYVTPAGTATPVNAMTLDDDESLNLGALGVLKINGTQVIGTRKTGWGAPSGTLSRLTFDQSTVTLAGLAQRVAALVTDLISHGSIGA